jgi:hypothetical protein
MDNLYFYEQTYIDILEYIKDRQDESKGNDNKPNILGLCSQFQHKFNISADTTRNHVKNLIYSGYLERGETIKTNIFITDKGKIFLLEHHQFQMLKRFNKATIYFNKNLVFITTILSVFFSFSSLIVSILVAIFHK